MNLYQRFSVDPLSLNDEDISMVLRLKFFEEKKILRKEKLVFFKNILFKYHGNILIIQRQGVHTVRQVCKGLLLIADFEIMSHLNLPV